MRRVPLGLWAMAGLSGVLQVLPFPIAGPVPLWRTHVCWVALLPLLWALVGRQTSHTPLTGGQGAMLGYVSGVLWYLGSCYWIYQTMHLYGGLAEPIAAGILVLFSLYVALYHALFGALVATAAGSRLGRQGALLLVPVLWVASELARARVTSFPWDPLGVTQVDNPLLRQMAPWTGVSGLSFVIAAVNALWLLRLQVRERRWTRPALAGTGVAIIVAYVFLLLHPRARAAAEKERGTATLLQENLEVGAADVGPPQSQAQLLEQFATLSRHPAATVLAGMPELPGTHVLQPQRLPALQLGEGTSALATSFTRTDVVIWPESPAPFKEGDPAFRTAMAGLAEQMGAPIIVGNIGLDQVRDRSKARGYDLFNSASFVRQDGSFAGRYDKMHLVPFGEYVPYKQLFFFAGSLLEQAGTFQPGLKRSVFRASGHGFGTFICYESIFGDEIRQFSTLGADVLVNISNDGWYGDTSAPWQHLNMVRMRALESHRWVLRATNTGVTSSIDPSGRVVLSAPRHTRTAIQVPFAYEHDITFYAAHGDLLPYGCALVSLGVVGFSVWSRRSSGPASRAVAAPG